MAQRDYYAVLEIGPDASEAEIREAYRRLARRYHPDLHPERADADARLKELNEAYEVLGHAERRARYRASPRTVRVRVTAQPRTTARNAAARPSPPPQRRYAPPSYVDLTGGRSGGRGHGTVDLSGATSQRTDPWAQGPAWSEQELLLLYLRRLGRALGWW
jgi:curved DNA-binding protein CbpA